MKAIDKLLLWLVTAALPVVIAACYGVPYSYGRYSKFGRAVDADTGEGVRGIQITCPYAEPGTNLPTFTAEDGTFALAGDAPCGPALFQDIDGEDNGGFYLEQLVRVTYGDDEEELVVALTRVEGVTAGQVVATEDGLGIPGIEISCIDGAGETLSLSTSLDDGRFFVGYEQPCDILRFEDPDGVDNHGNFEPKDVSFDPDAEALVVELERAPVEE